MTSAIARLASHLLYLITYNFKTAAMTTLSRQSTHDATPSPAQLPAERSGLFCLPMPDQALAGAGIEAGCLLEVDGQGSPVQGCLVVAAVDGELLVRRLQRSGSRLQLLAAHPDYPLIEPSYEQDFAIWGVVAEPAALATRQA
ncbi:LexA family protein [Aquitalea aquatica]|uniref:S24 family peptidase n=1 Tax=Aquitalea aquatica TaxID=3044273 RepID=A0A838Y4R1_9NEIS|nr:S24 family peptidase [Aquitalea magnusonii]MBA4710383.1 S24 family peptidase [Aquitalea magnusonii]